MKFRVADVIIHQSKSYQNFIPVDWHFFLPGEPWKLMTWNCGSVLPNHLTPATAQFPLTLRTSRTEIRQFQPFTIPTTQDSMDDEAAHKASRITPNESTPLRPGAADGLTDSHRRLSARDGFILLISIQIGSGIFTSPRSNSWTVV